MDLAKSCLEFIRNHDLLATGERVLVAVSGGVDSVTLAQLFHSCGWAFDIAHANFQLRGDESDADEAFVRELASAWQVDCVVNRFDTKQFAEANSLSTQMAARQLRYPWFETLRAERGCAAVATGHHLNDSVETALLHFIRGTGLSGLGGIPVRNRNVIRPLLFATRDEILAYARSAGLRWREDSSNASDTYTRNALRRHIVPRMQEINPAFIDAAGRTLQQLRAADANLQYLLRRLLGAIDADGVYHLPKHKIAGLPAPADALFDLLQPFGFTPEQARQMMANQNHTGAEWYSDAGYRLVNDRQDWLLAPAQPGNSPLRIEADDVLVRLPDGSRLALTPAAAGMPVPDPGVAVVVDAEKLSFPLHLRRWWAGDAFQPLGMAGKSQKLQDFFTNRKLSRLDKEHVWVLTTADNTIVWVLGLRSDERFKTSDGTSKILKITWLKQ